MRRVPGKLFVRLAAAYAGVTLATAAAMRLSNTYISRYSEALDSFNVKAVLVYAAASLMALTFFTLFRLRLGSGGRRDVWTRMMRFPSELFVFVLVYTCIATLAYIYAETVFLGFDPLAIESEEQRLMVQRGLLLNLTTAIFLAAAYYSLSVWLLRPFLEREAPVRGRMRFGSFAVRLIVAFVCLLAIVLVRICWYVYNAARIESGVSIGTLLAIAGAGLAVGFVMFYVLLVGFKKEMLSMIRHIRILLGADAGRLHRPIPVASNDEIGALAMMHNELQERIRSRYVQLQADIETARRIERELYPLGPASAAGLIFERYPVPEGVWSDTVELPGERAVVLLGRIDASGISASLLISAVTALFRAESNRTGGLADRCVRLQEAFREAFGAEHHFRFALAEASKAEAILTCAAWGMPEPVLAASGAALGDRAVSIEPPAGSAPQTTRYACRSGDVWLFHADTSAPEAAAAIRWPKEDGDAFGTP